MRLYIQFPVADYRTFIGRSETLVLNHPSWLVTGFNGVELGKEEFVRFFGKIKTNRNDHNIINKSKICAANRAVIFRKPPVFVCNNLKIDFKVNKSFTFDSWLVGQFEISITNIVTTTNNGERGPLRLSEELADALVKHFINLPVDVLNPDYDGKEDKRKFVECKLYQLGKYLSSAYWKASTSTLHPSYAENKHLVQAGKPVLFLETKQEESIELPEDWKPIVIWDSGFIKKFQFSQGEIEKLEIPIFILKSVSEKDNRIATDVRSYVLDILAKTACLNLIGLDATKNNIDLTVNEAILGHYRISKNGSDRVANSIYKCAADEMCGSFGKSTLIKLRESRGDFIQKMKNFLTQENIEGILSGAEAVTRIIKNVR